jgi:hypothetical protein
MNDYTWLDSRNNIYKVLITNDGGHSYINNNIILEVDI